MSQSEFGAAGGVLKNAQSSYETDKRFPDANYLAKIAKLGVDVGYVLTGEKYSPIELDLLEAFRELNDAQKHAFVSLLGVIIKN